MLTFYPEFETQSLLEPEIFIVMDMSNSMKGEAEKQAKKVSFKFWSTGSCLFFFKDEHHVHV